MQRKIKVCAMLLALSLTWLMGAFLALHVLVLLGTRVG